MHPAVAVEMREHGDLAAVAKRLPARIGGPDETH